MKMKKDTKLSQSNTKASKSSIKIEGVIDAENSLKPSFFHRLCKILGRICIWFFITLLILVIGLFISLSLICKGPSTYIRNLFVSSCLESGAGGIIPKFFFNNDEITNIVSQNKLIVNNEITDTTLVHINSNRSSDEKGIKDISIDSIEKDIVDLDGDGIETYEIHGSTYRGMMMIVFDPSRLKVAVSDKLNIDGDGDTLINLVNKYDAVAGINGGQYESSVGLGHSGMPQGIVISEGNLLIGDPDATYDVYGFTNDDVLVVGTMTANEALNMGIRDAVTFGPALITNGKPAKTVGYGSGLNPRTAIGQRSDGAVLLLVIEGGQTDSLGATYADLIKIMTQYGAINAANLDGGMSSSMIYSGEEIITNCQLNQSPKIPTAFVVERRNPNEQ